MAYGLWLWPMAMAYGLWPIILATLSLYSMVDGRLARASELVDSRPRYLVLAFIYSSIIKKKDLKIQGYTPIATRSLLPYSGHRPLHPLPIAVLYICPPTGICIWPVFGLYLAPRA